jgi:hypothetical protein
VTWQTLQVTTVQLPVLLAVAHCKPSTLLLDFTVSSTQHVSADMPDHIHVQLYSLHMACYSDGTCCRQGRLCLITSAAAAAAAAAGDEILHATQGLLMVSIIRCYDLSDSSKQSSYVSVSGV